MDYLAEQLKRSGESTKLCGTLQTKNCELDLLLPTDRDRHQMEEMNQHKTVPPTPTPYVIPKGYHG